MRFCDSIALRDIDNESLRFIINIAKKLLFWRFFMGKLICVDAGHGGTDSGAVGNGIKEKDITLKAALKVGELLKKQGFNVIFTRVSDKFINLGERCRIANSNSADLFISVHINSASNVQARGTETLCYSRNSFAEIAQKNLIDYLKTKDRGVKERKDLYVLNGTKMLAVLFEIAFISNSQDAALLKKELFLDDFTKAVVKSVCKHYGVNFIDGEKKQENEKQEIVKKETVELKKNIDVVLNGKKETVSGYFADGKNLFTSDFLRELGFKVGYDKNTKVVTLDNDDIRNIKVVVNGDTKEVSAVLRNDFNYVLLRDLEKLGIFDLEYKDGVIYLKKP